MFDSSCSSLTPSGPASLKPALKITAALTPDLAQSSRVPGTKRAGTAITARSASAPMSDMFLNADRPNMSAEEGFTGYIFPL